MFITLYDVCRPYICICSVIIIGYVQVNFMMEELTVFRMVSLFLAFYILVPFWYGASGLFKSLSHQFFICYLSNVSFWLYPLQHLNLDPLLTSSATFLLGSEHPYVIYIYIYIKKTEIFYGCLLLNSMTNLNCFYGCIIS